MELHRAGEGLAFDVTAGKRDTHNAVEPIRRHKGHVADGGLAPIIVVRPLCHRDIPAAVVQLALGGGGRGEADIADAPAGDAGTEAVKIPGTEVDAPPALVIVGNVHIQPLGHVHHDFPGELTSGDTISGIADLDRAHEALGGDKGDLI